MEKGFEKRGTSKLGKLPVDAFEPQPTPVVESTHSQSPVLLSLVGPLTPPGTPSQHILSQRDPLGLLDAPRIPSPRTANIIGERWKAKKEYRPASKEWEEAGLLPAAKPGNRATEFDCDGKPFSRPRDWYCPKPHNLGLDILWNLGALEVPYARRVVLRPFPTKKTKASPWQRTRLREGQVELREATEEGAQAMDFESYAGHFALGPKAQAEVARRRREDVERNSAKQAAAEGKRVADEIERQDKKRIEKELKEATVAKLTEYRGPQQGERVEYSWRSILKIRKCILRFGRTLP